MIFEIVLIVIAVFCAIFTTALWFDSGYKGGIPASLVFGLLVLVLFSSHLRSRTYAAEVLAVNKDRAGDISFSVGDSISVERRRAEGILAPFQVAVRKAEDGRVEVLDNENRITWWKFNSKALQFELEPGKTYEFQVAGWMGLNIVSLEPISPVPGCQEQVQEVASGPTSVQEIDEQARPSP